jgi:quercetin dioxygenase-like cupin family protein
MNIRSLGSPLAPRVDWGIFEGEVLAEQVVGEDGASDIRIYDVTFRPGGRTVWHTHEVDQILVITAGHGIVATETEEREVRTGDLVVIPANERHWHGATETTEMTHLAVMTEGKDVY